MKSRAYDTGLVHSLATPGQFDYALRDFPGSDCNIRRSEAFHLPPGATILKKSSNLVESRLPDGRIELRVEQIIPPDGSIYVEFRFKLAN
jgi:hypothetical protein